MTFAIHKFNIKKIKMKKGKINAGWHLSKVMGDDYMDLHTKAAQGAFVV